MRDVSNRNSKPADRRARARRRPANAGMAGTVVAALIGVLASGCGRTRDSDGAYERRPAGTVTFASDIAPILHEECASCHRSEGSAPFPLLSYDEAAAMAPAIADAVESGRMPPWLPTRRGPRLVGERRLTAEQRGLLLQWVEDGAPAGDLAAAPPAPQWPDGWQLGQPDLVISLPQRYRLSRGAPEEFRNFVMANSLAQRQYVRTAEFRFSDERVVHHAMLMIDRTGQSRTLDQMDMLPGYDGMLGDAQVPQGFFVGWTPGRVPEPGEPDLAWPLEPGADVVLQLHLRPRPESTLVDARVGLYFAERPPRRMPTMLHLGSQAIDVPADDSSYVIDDEYRLPVDVEVLGLYPHLHYLGKSVEAWAVSPLGDTTWLVEIRDWNFNWQDAYYYDEPIALLAGSVIRMRYTYDNSTANPRNPNTPPRRVLYGPESTDEMGDLWLSVLPRDSAALAILHADFAQKSVAMQLDGLEKKIRVNPRDDNAYNVLGAFLQRLGRVDEAIARYREQLAITPDHPNAHFNLATALQSTGRLDEAIPHYREALRVAPEHANAANNLGNALLSRGDLDGAAEAYRRALAIRPEHADAHYNLGLVLRSQGRSLQAAEHWREAMRARPEWPEPLASLAWMLATDPDPAVRRPPEAVEIAQRAVELTDRQDASMLTVLSAAHAAAGRFDLAIRVAEEARAIAEVTAEPELAALIAALTEQYRQGQPYREPMTRGALGDRPR